ncbi:MAG: LytTR family DNA-binding domain-containing protein [Pyrinomonadaceae bacterium]
MAQFRVLIVDDEPLARERIRELLKRDREFVVAAEASSGRAAIDAINTDRPDLVFLDVQMPDLDGFEVLRLLEVEPLPLPLIIFVTAFDQHAVRAFEFHAIDYLMKPFDRERFGRALDHAKKQLKRPDDENALGVRQLLADQRVKKYLERFAVKTGEKVVFVPAQNVDAIEAEGNYARLKVGAVSYLVRETISSIEAQLDPNIFVRIHRATIVNKRRVKELQTWTRGEYRVILHNGTWLKLSRGYREHFDKSIK